MANELYHYGIQGMKWGVRRFQNADGSYTDIGRKRHADGISGKTQTSIKNARANISTRYSSVKTRTARPRKGKRLEFTDEQKELAKKAAVVAGVAVGVAVAAKFGNAKIDALKSGSYQIAQMEGQKLFDEAQALGKVQIRMLDENGAFDYATTDRAKKAARGVYETDAFNKAMKLKNDYQETHRHDSAAEAAKRVRAFNKHGTMNLAGDREELNSGVGSVGSAVKDAFRDARKAKSLDEAKDILYSHGKAYRNKLDDANRKLYDIERRELERSLHARSEAELDAYWTRKQKNPNKKDIYEAEERAMRDAGKLNAIDAANQYYDSHVNGKGDSLFDMYRRVKGYERSGAVDIGKEIMRAMAG